MFGKLMSISDDLMWRYIELLSFEPLQKINLWKKQTAGGGNPRDIKVTFAKEIVARFHSAAAAQQAEETFEKRHRHGEAPEDMPEVALAVPKEGILLPQLIKAAGLAPSASEAARAIEQGGVRIDGERVADRGLRLMPGAGVVIQVGKRKFARVRLT